MGKSIVLKKENIKKYNIAIENAIKVLNDKNASQEEVYSAIEVLNTRLSEVSFIIEKPNNKEENNSLENKDDQKQKTL